MMSRKELHEHYDRVSALYQTKLSADGIRIYQHSLEHNQGILPDPQLLEDMDTELARLGSAIERDTEAIKARTPEVEITLKQIPESVCRTMARLHFVRGLSWKEVGALLGRSEGAVKVCVDRYLPAAKSTDSK